MPKREVKGDPEFHRKAFEEFIRWELAVGGPDPHMKIAKWISQEIDEVERRAWFVGCYIGPYNVPTAEAIFHYWPAADMVLAQADQFTAWVHDNWKRLVLRRERRPVLAPHKFSEHMLDYANFVVSRDRFRKLRETKSFTKAWDIVTSVRYNGRYASMKLYEALRRICDAPAHEFENIMPEGGWSPRLALSWLHPRYAAELNGSDNPRHLLVANAVAEYERDWLAAQGLRLDWFNTEVMLCDYKQAYDGKQYPGRAHDSELGHLLRVSSNFPEVEFLTLQARRALFPYEALGEFGGWSGRREPLGEVLIQHGYTWCDLLYDWDRSADDLANPVKRGIVAE